MDIKTVTESGFFKTFIAQYLEHHIYTVHSPKDKLLYVLCDNETEKEIVTKQEIEKLKMQIKELGFEELSFAYILGSDPKSNYYIKDYDKRTEFWLNKFAEDFHDHINSLTVVNDNVEEISKLYKKHHEDHDEDEFHIYFWDIMAEHRPIDDNIMFVIGKEQDLVDQLESDIESLQEDELFDINFDNYKKYIEYVKYIQILFQYCDLLLSLHRYEMFKSFLPQKANEIQSNDFENRIWFKVGLLWANGQMTNLLSKHRSNCTKIAKELGNSSYRPYISESLSNTNDTDKNIFKSPDKIQVIRKYCTENKIEMSEEFTRRIPS